MCEALLSRPEGHNLETSGILRNSVGSDGLSIKVGMRVVASSHTDRLRSKFHPEMYCCVDNKSLYSHVVIDTLFNYRMLIMTECFYSNPLLKKPNFNCKDGSVATV